MKSRYCSILFVALVSLTSLCLSQSEKRITIEHADSLIGKVINGEEVQELIGNVRFFQDKVVVTCDHAVQFRQSGNIELLGNVVIVEDSLTMRFPRGMYYRLEQRAVAYDSVRLDDGRVILTARYGEYSVEPKKAFFRNHVVATDKESRLTSDSLTYFRSEQRTIALSNVEIQSYPDNLTIRGGQFLSLKKEQYSRMTIHPVVIKFDTSTSGDV
ncbi:MAG: OstA-like protein, partial [bacterium]